MTNEERVWWNALINAEVISEANMDQGTAENELLYTNIAVNIRKTIRDKFGVNLDETEVEARKLLELLVAEEKVKDENDKAERARARAAVAKAKKLLGK